MTNTENLETAERPRKESFFDFDELFFSRTDMKGIIQSGNSVFQRVSQYGWDELLQKPHSLIRNSRMPRGVFHLLWETILSGKPIGAYVNNQAKDGSPYWVFALVLPIPNGFLSIRLKPSSPIFEIVKMKYDELLATEQTSKLSPKDSQAHLLRILAGLGFKNYSQFMITALSQELESRQVQLKVPPIAILFQLRSILKLGGKLQESSEAIANSYHHSSLVPLNLEVQAARIGPEAATIATISTQYESLANQIQIEISKFTQAGAMVQQKVQECQFNICNSLLQKEMYAFFRNETKPTPIQKDIEMGLLETLGKKGIESSIASLTEIDLEFSKFNAIYEDVRKLSVALEIVSLTGQIEVAKIKQNNVELVGLLNDLGVFKNSLKGSLKEIEQVGSSLMSQTHTMRNSISEAFKKTEVY